MMRRLEPRQWETLVRICRTVKETLLSDGAPGNDDRAFARRGG